MKSIVILFEDGTYEIERNCVPDIMDEQMLYYGRNGRRGLAIYCEENKIEASKKTLAQFIIDECYAQIREAKKKQNKFQKILDSL